MALQHSRKAADNLKWCADNVVHRTNPAPFGAKKRVVLQDSELSIQIHSFNSTPMVSMTGLMDEWHGTTIDLMLNSFSEMPERELILDLSSLKFTGFEGTAALIKSLRCLTPELRVHTVAGEELASILERANIGACASISINVEKLPGVLRPGTRYLTSRRMHQMNSEELPIAA